MGFWDKKGERGEEEGEGAKHRCAGEASIGRLSHTPNRAPGLQPRHVSQVGTELETLWFSGWCPAPEPHQSGQTI